MKAAQELRVGNVVMVDDNPVVVQRADYNTGKSGRHTAAVVKFKFKNLLTDAPSEGIYKATEKFEVIVLEHRACTYSYYAEPSYVFMDEEFNQYEVDEENMGNALNYLEEEMEVQVVFYDGRPISVELPNVVVREITYTEPAVRGDTSGKVTKPAQVGNNLTVQVPLFCNIGDKIEIDTRTDEYRSRV